MLSHSLTIQESKPALPAVMKILDCATIVGALKIVDGLSAEEIAYQDNTGATILHHLCLVGAKLPFKLYRKTLMEIIIEKNAAILNLKWNELDNPLQYAFRLGDVEAIGVLLPYYEKDSITIKERNLTVDEQGKVIKEGSIDMTPLAFALLNGLFAMFEFLYTKGFGPVKGLGNLAKYNLKNPTRENLQTLYQDLFLAGNRDELRSLHGYLGYYEGFEGKNSPELIAAVQAGNEEEALKLLSRGHYVYHFGEFDFFLMKKICKFFFYNNLHHPNYNLVVKDKDGWTPLHYAATEGHTEMAKVLLEAVENNPKLLKKVFKPNKIGRTPLHYAASNGHTETANALLEAVKERPKLLETLFKPDEDGDTPLHLAAMNSHTEVVKALLEAAKESPKLLKILFKPDEDGDTPLHWATMNGCTETAKVLIEAVENNSNQLKKLHKPNKKGWTPLHHAANNGHTKTAKALLEAVKERPKLLETLFKPDEDGDTPLHLAAMNGHTEIAKALIEAVKNKSKQLKKLCKPNKKGCTPLYRAAVSGRIETAKALIEAVKDLPSNYSAISMRLAVVQGHTEVVKALLEATKGSYKLFKKICRPTKKHGTSLLHLAMRHGHTEVVKALLEATKGSHKLLKVLFKPNKYGETPLQFASRENKPELVRLLLVFGARPPFSMVFSNTFSDDVNLYLRLQFAINFVVSTCSVIYSVVEGASKAFSGDITDFYDKGLHNHQNILNQREVDLNR